MFNYNEYEKYTLVDWNYSDWKQSRKVCEDVRIEAKSSDEYDLIGRIADSSDYLRGLNNQNWK
jgi:hypothetical protein